MTGTRLPFLLTMERTFPILDVAPTGAGVGYPDGVRTFVPGALPGDVVACDWTPPEKGRQSQVIDRFEFVEHAAKRAPEPCPHLCGAPACGGCPLGTLLYREQCRLKAKLLEDACRAAGREDWAKLVTPPELFVKQRAFRNKAFFTPLRTTEGIRFGMYAAGSHEKVALDTCPQLPAWMNECQRAAARVLSEALADRPDAVYDETRHTGILRGLLLREGTLGRMAVFVVKDLSPALEETLGKLLAEELRGLSLTSLLWSRYDARGNRTTGEDFTAIEGTGRVETELLGLTFFVGPDTFLQVNPSETERLYKKVLERASVGPEDKVLDLYSGVGTITLLLAQSAARVVSSTSPAIRRPSCGTPFRSKPRAFASQVSRRWISFPARFTSRRSEPSSGSDVCKKCKTQGGAFAPPALCRISRCRALPDSGRAAGKSSGPSPCVACGRSPEGLRARSCRSPSASPARRRGRTCRGPFRFG